MLNKKIEWNVLPKITEEFINENSEYNPIILQLLKNRGFNNKNEFEQILNPNYDKIIHDPFLFNQMEEVVSKIISHIKMGNKIFIYGDYDADGVTSSALLYETLNVLKAKVDVYIPDRVTEGYGLNEKAIEFIKSKDGKLIITVDTGIRSNESVDFAKKQGLEVIITDHHVSAEKKEDLPDCLILDPVVPDEKYPFKKLAGVGVAYKLACAIISKAKLENELKDRLCERLLDLVAIGTGADCVVLLDENRMLVKRGLEVLSSTKRIGLLELMRIAQVKNREKIASWNIGFQIGPRINAAGRMKHANSAYELMITNDQKKAITLAYGLNENNIERQNKTVQILEQAEEQISGDEKIIVCISPKDEKWNEGIVGLVAGRICEKYYRPTLIITENKKSYKGSGRSIDGFNLIKAIEECKDYLEKYGGHPMACGFSLKKENLEKFKQKLREITDKNLKDKNLTKSLKIETELDLNEVDEDLINEIKKLEPYGEGNLQPKFLIKNLFILDVFYMGNDGQHVKFKLKNSDSKIINAIGFNQSEKWKDINLGDKIDVVCYLDINEFNGKKEEQMRIVDIKVSE